MDEHMSEYNPKWGRASWPIIWNKDYKIQQEKDKEQYDNLIKLLSEFDESYLIGYSMLTNPIDQINHNYQANEIKELKSKINDLNMYKTKLFNENQLLKQQLLHNPRVPPCAKKRSKIYPNAMIVVLPCDPCLIKKHTYSTRSNTKTEILHKGKLVARIDKSTNFPKKDYCYERSDLK